MMGPLSLDRTVGKGRVITVLVDVLPVPKFHRSCKEATEHPMEVTRLRTGRLNEIHPYMT
jgi:hypothetical protein